MGNNKIKRRHNTVLMITPEEFAEVFIIRMEAAPTLEELDKIAEDIKGWRDFLATSYQSNKDRLMNTSKPVDITK